MTNPKLVISIFVKSIHKVIEIYIFYPYVDENIFLRDLFRIKCHWEDDILLKKSPKVGRFTF